ncbi:MAG: carboxymuconolactone decarboxylase family protein [Xanthomonadaceae bacterium]|nr:carboxymuconolactone decarboxylase family protein [Xanthomonadaceae bacterium]
MRTTTRARQRYGRKVFSAVLALAFGIGSVCAHAADPAVPRIPGDKMMSTEQALSSRQQAIAPIAAFAATGDMPRLENALEQGLDAGLSVGDCKEILVQLYAYVGFPRSLNALGELMKVVNERKQRGLHDEPGREPGPVPTGAELLAIGTANQTRLSGAPVKGALFEFAPAIDQYLKAHLFGDIFARDNLDWQSRELATVGALAALQGVDSQLQAHMRISRNTGISEAQLQQLVAVLRDRVGAEAADRAEAGRSRSMAP